MTTITSLLSIHHTHSGKYFFLVMRNFKINSLRNCQIHSIILAIMNSAALYKFFSAYNHISEYTLEQNGQVIRCAIVQLHQIWPGVSKVVEPIYIPINLQKTILVALNPHKHLVSLVFSIQPFTGETRCSVLPFFIFFIINEVKYTFICLPVMKF